MLACALVVEPGFVDDIVGMPYEVVKLPGDGYRLIPPLPSTPQLCLCYYLEGSHLLQLHFFGWDVVLELAILLKENGFPRLQVRHILHLWKLLDVLQGAERFRLQFLANVQQGFLQHRVLALYLPKAIDHYTKGLANPGLQLYFLLF